MSHVSSLLVASPDTDTDRDGISDVKEFQTGTNPADPRSYFTLLSVQSQSDGTMAVRWSSVEGKYYSILSSTNLLIQGWSILASNQFATPPVNSFLDASRQSQRARFYQIRLEP